MDLVLFGIQGSGKGTQAKRLAEDYGYAIFEAGGELRKIAASGSELGQTVKSYIDEGNLVPHEIIMQVVKEAILSYPEDQPLLFDGIPRDADQQRDFDKIMNDVGREFQAVQIVIPRDEAYARIAGRAEKEGRADDQDTEKVTRRIETFLEKTMQVVEDYVSRGVLVEIDGMGTVDEVYERLGLVIE